MTSDYRQALSSLRKETVQNDDDELMCDIIETGIDMLESQNTALLEALEKLDNCLDTGTKIKPDSRIHDFIQEAIRKAKGDRHAH